MYAIYDIFVGDSIRTGEIGMCRFTGERNRSWIHSILMYESMIILLPHAQSMVRGDGCEEDTATWSPSQPPLPLEMIR